jgi:hypothetical protein
MKKLSKIVMGLIFTIVGVSVAVFLPEKASLTCDRTTQRCELDKGVWWNRSQTTFPLAQLQSATVQTNRRRKTRLYGVQLNTSTKTIRLTETKSLDKDSKQKTADQINAFVKNPTERSLQIKQDDNALLLVFGGVLLIVGIVLLSPFSHKKSAQ